MTPGVRGVFATTGGKGAYRIAPHLDFEAARDDPKPFVGFSDITYLHLALHRADVAGSMHGPFVNWSDEYYGSDCAEGLRRSLMDPDPVVISSRLTDYTAQLSAGGIATGVLVGGHFDSISRAVGWALPNLDHAILLLEDHHGTDSAKSTAAWHSWCTPGCSETSAGSLSAPSVSSRPPQPARPPSLTS